MLLNNGVISANGEVQFGVEPNTIVSVIANGPLEIIIQNGELESPSLSAPTLGGHVLLHKLSPSGGTVSFVMPGANCALFNRSTQAISFEVFGTEPA